MRFRNREEAGALLAAALKPFALRRPLVLGIPRGGIIPALAVAEGLGGELDVVLIRKIGAPMDPEVALGAVGEDGMAVWNYDPLAPEIPEGFVERELDREMRALRSRRAAYTPWRPPRSARGRDVVVVDDGVATGATMLAALRMLRRDGPRRLVAATPVVAPQCAPLLRAEADELVAVMTPEDFTAVGGFYADFKPVDDETVMSILRRTVTRGPKDHDQGKGRALSPDFPDRRKAA